MNIGLFLLAIALIGQAVMALTMLGSAYMWPIDKLDHKNLLFLANVWACLLGLIIAMAGLNKSTISFNFGQAILGFTAAVLILSAIRTQNMKYKWLGTGACCAFITIGLALTIF